MGSLCALPELRAVLVVLAAGLAPAVMITNPDTHILKKVGFALSLVASSLARLQHAVAMQRGQWGMVSFSSS